MCLLYASGAPRPAAAATDLGASLEDARRAAAQPRQALEKVLANQPQDPKAASWAEWEALRCALLGALGDHAALLARAAALPGDMPPALELACLLPAAKSALATGAPAVVRRHAARALWQLKPDADAIRALRLTVIDSHAAEGGGEEAFRAMLRFQQDYRPLGRAEATRFTEALLDLGMERDAVNWLAALDDAGSTKLLVRLRAGLIAPEAAVEQARTQIARSGDPGHWRVIGDAGQRLKNPALEVEAAEQLLQARVPSAPKLAARLWELYLSAAQDAANEHRLLVGDEANWADRAARLAATRPALSRALYAHAVRHASLPQTRYTAQLQLVYSLVADRLERTALRIAEAAGFTPDTLDPQARYLLGAAAERHSEPRTAWHYWRGLDAPPGVDPAAWGLRVAAMAAAAGAPDAAMASLRRVVASGSVLRGEAGQIAARLGDELLEIGPAGTARAALEMLLPVADSATARRLHYALARLHDRAGEPALAAQNYLRSAMLFEGKLPDALAADARLQAAYSLARAGQRDEARAQFAWILKHSRDAAQLESARRELARP